MEFREGVALNHVHARLVYSVLLLLDIILLVVQFVVYKVPSFLDIINADFGRELMPNPWVYLFSLDLIIDPWRIATLILVGAFVFLESKRSGLKNWWIFLLLGIASSYLLGLLAFLVYREHVLLNRGPFEEQSTTNSFDYLKITRLLLGLGILYFLANQLYYIIEFEYYWLYTFDINGPWDFVLVSKLFHIPLILFFVIEQSRQRIEFWWTAIPVYLVFNFVPAFPFFLWLKERSANKDLKIEQQSDAAT